MLSEAVLVLVIAIEVLEKTTKLGIDYEHDCEHEHDRINWRAKPRGDTEGADGLNEQLHLPQAILLQLGT